MTSQRSLCSGFWGAATPLTAVGVFLEQPIHQAGSCVTTLDVLIFLFVKFSIMSLANLHTGSHYHLHYRCGNSKRSVWIFRRELGKREKGESESQMDNWCCGAYEEKGGEKASLSRNDAVTNLG